MNKNDYYLTIHAIERFQERFARIVEKDELMSKWNRKKGVLVAKSFFDKIISETTENASHLNNTNQMVYIYEKYGYNCEYKFLEHTELGILFLMTKQRSEKKFVLVTIMPTKFKNKFALNTVKYNNKETKEDKQTKNINQQLTKFKNILFSFQNVNLSPIQRLSELEKVENFSLQYKKELYEFLSVLCFNTMVDNEDIVFCSKNYEYQIKKEKGVIIDMQLNALNENKKRQSEDYFHTIENLKILVSVSTVLSKINNLSQREVVLDDKIYTFTYDDKTDNVFNVRCELLSTEQLINHIDKQNMKNLIEKNIKENYYHVLDTNSEPLLLCQTTVKDKTVIFDYNENSKDIEIRFIDYTDRYFGVNKDSILPVLLATCKNNKAKVVKELNYNKIIKMSTYQQKEYTFIHFTDKKDLILLDIKDAPKNVITAAVKEKKEVKNNIKTQEINLNYLSENVVINNDYLINFKDLTDTLTPELELFLKKEALKEETILKIVSTKKVIHRASYGDETYDYLMNNKKQEGYVVTLLKKL